MKSKIIILFSFFALFLSSCGNKGKNEYFKDGIYKKSYEYKCRCESLKLMDNYFTVKTISEAEGLCSNKSLNKSLIAKPRDCIPYDSRFSDPIKADPNAALECYCGANLESVNNTASMYWKKFKNLWTDDDRIVSGANYEEASLKCKKLNLNSPDNDRYLAKACENSN